MPNISIQPSSVMLASGREYAVKADQWSVFTEVVLDSTARDSGNTPTTVLRKGLVLGKVTTTGKFKEYDDGDSDGTEVARYVLDDDKDLLDAEGNVKDVDGARVMKCGIVDRNALFGIDDNGANDMSGANSTGARQGSFFVFDNDI